MLHVLRIRDFRLLWGGGLVSSLGSWLLVLAVPAHILAATGSLRDTGLALAAQYLPQLALGPAAGVIADGWDRRRLMIGTNLFCAGAVAVMLLGTSPGRYWVLYASLPAAAAVAMSGSMALAVQQTTLQRVIPGPVLGRVSAVFLTGEAATTVVGSVAGPFLAQAAHITALATAASLVTVGAAVLALLTVPPMPSTFLSRFRTRHRGTTILVIPATLQEGNRVDLEQALTRLVESATEELHIVRKRAEGKTPARDHGHDFHEMETAADRVDHYAHLLRRLHDNELGQGWRHESRQDVRS